MQIIVHRVNKIEQLRQISKNYGVEIDIRGYGSKLLLNHDPLGDDLAKYDELEDYLKNYQHSFIIFNLKEAGHEKRVIDLAKKYGVDDYFLLDVEFPYLYRATRRDKIRKIAVRFSEIEPIEVTLAQFSNGQPLVDWVWIDVNTILPLNEKVVEQLKLLKTCLVCPELWGRPEDIPIYTKKMKALNFCPSAIMTAWFNVKVWEDNLKE